MYICVCICYTYIYSLSDPFSIMGYYKTLSVIPCAVYSRFLFLTMRILYSKLNDKSSWTGIIPGLQSVECHDSFQVRLSLTVYHMAVYYLDTERTASQVGQRAALSLLIWEAVSGWETGLEHLQRSSWNGETWLEKVTHEYTWIGLTSYGGTLSYQLFADATVIQKLLAQRLKRSLLKQLK